MASCATARIAIVPQGGNTGLVGGQTPDESGDEIVLSLQRLKRIREIDPLDRHDDRRGRRDARRGAGGGAGADRLFPLSLASEGTCTIGGNLSTNAGGVAVLAYGNARELVDRRRGGAAPTGGSSTRCRSCARTTPATT